MVCVQSTCIPVLLTRPEEWRHKAKAKAPSHKADDWTYMDDSTQADKSSWKAILALLTVHTCFICMSIKKISPIRQLLHLRKTSISSRLSVVRARCRRTSNPLREKTRSTGTEVAGMKEAAQTVCVGPCTATATAWSAASVVFRRRRTDVDVIASMAAD